MNERESLLAVLHANPGNARANDCLAALAAHPDAKIVRTAPLPRAHVLDILRKRGELSAAGITRGGAYEAPLAALAATSSSTVRVTDITIGGGDWIVLTTPGDHLIEVLTLAPR